MSATRTVHVVPHTHWDREWYQPFQTFRMKLVDLVDGLLALMEAHPEFAFTLDGQLATVDDYLEVRPEQEPRLRRYIAEGRLAIGPWQILMDEFLPSGETIVRNLEKGWRRAEELGGVMRIGYLPDMFGHIAQMPQILRRAGIGDAVLWRGVPAAIDHHVFAWEAPDGSTVRTEYLFGGYGNAAHLLAIPEALEDKVAGFVEQCAPLFDDDDVLAMLGTDHATPVPEVAELVGDLDAAQERFDVGLATLDSYIGQTRERSDARCRWHGELRSAARANMLPGVTSTRIDSKIAGGRAERAVERYAEPLAALHGAAWPERLLELAWARLIDNSAHDSVCSCSLDEVVDHVRVRYAEAEQIARGIADRAVAHVARLAPRGAFMAVNPSPYRREGLVELDVASGEPGTDTALRTSDGRLLATEAVERAESLLLSRTGDGRGALAVFDLMHGRELFGRQLNRVAADRVDGHHRLSFHVDIEPDPPSLDLDHVRAEADAAVASAPDAVWEARIVGRARRTLQAMAPVPALGVETLTPVPGRGELTHPVRVGEGSIDNGLVRVQVDGDGTWTLAGGGREFAGVGRITDGGDAGDSYNYGPPEDDLVVDQPRRVDVAAEQPGPVRGRLLVRRTYAWPVGLSADRRTRNDDRRDVTVDTRLELRAGQPFVRVDVVFDNPCEDHRVRFHVPLPAPVRGSAAAGQFGVAERDLDVEAGHGEHPLPTFPARGFVTVDGVAALLGHATEYEVVGGRELALTLLRATGMISRNVHPYRAEPAGPEIAVPAAQCRGPLRVGFALYPHRGAWREAGVADQAERYRHPLLVDRGTGERDEPLPEGLRVDGAGVQLSALRRRDTWLELRVVCLQPEPTSCLVGPGVTRARRADLFGRPLDTLPVSDGRLALDLGPWEIRTVQLQR